MNRAGSDESPSGVGSAGDLLSGMPELVRARMRELEEMDRRDKVDGTHHDDRLRQVPPETGRFLALMASLAPEGPMLELGASGGYSTLWLAMACRALHRKLTTCEILPGKATLARETIHKAGVQDLVHLVEDDALNTLLSFDSLALCFWDCDKARSADYYREAVSRLIPGGLFLADNAISHADRMAPALDMAMSDQRVDALVVPIGKGVLVCRRSG